MLDRVAGSGERREQRRWASERQRRTGEEEDAARCDRELVESADHTNRGREELSALIVVQRSNIPRAGGW
jgi:hypothetical protein